MFLCFSPGSHLGPSFSSNSQLSLKFSVKSLPYFYLSSSLNVFLNLLNPQRPLRLGPRSTCQVRTAVSLNAHQIQNRKFFPGLSLAESFGLTLFPSEPLVFAVILCCNTGEKKEGTHVKDLSRCGWHAEAVFMLLHLTSG